MINGLKTVESQDGMSHNKEMNNMRNQRHNSADEPIGEHMPNRMERKDRYAYVSMMREINNQMNTAQTRQRRKFKKIMHQK